jgi:hypothetical protein
VREGMSIYLHVFFEDPFWVGVFSISSDNNSRYCRVVFGKEPTDAEIYAFLQKEFNGLKFSQAEQVITEKSIDGNPKRRQRQISKEIHNSNRIKKSYEIVKQSLSQSNKNKHKEQRERKNDHFGYVMELKRAKHKEKHRGH